MLLGHAGLVVLPAKETWAGQLIVDFTCENKEREAWALRDGQQNKRKGPGRAGLVS